MLASNLTGAFFSLYSGLTCNRSCSSLFLPPAIPKTPKWYEKKKKNGWDCLTALSHTGHSFQPAAWGPAKWVSVYKWIWVSAEINLGERTRALRGLMPELGPSSTVPALHSCHRAARAAQEDSCCQAARWFVSLGSAGTKGRPRRRPGLN